MQTASPIEETTVVPDETGILPRITPRTQRHSQSALNLEPGTYLVIDDLAGPVAIRLEEGTTHIGRDFAADIRLEDLSLSRRHAILVHGSGETVILDDRSANGTLLNGERVLRATLRDGDVVVLGSTVMHYVVRDY